MKKRFLPIFLQIIVAIIALFIFVIPRSISFAQPTVSESKVEGADFGKGIEIYDVHKVYETLNLGIEAESCILIDSNTGQILYSQDADKPGIYPASTTKIMTAIVALENADLDQVMIASQAAINDIGDGGMNIGIMAGEKICFRDLLNAMLVCSANETANIIAENIASSREEFIDMMNKRAKELGAINTNFVNTCGIHNDEHYTTARDMAIIARHAMTIPVFREIVKKDHYNMFVTNKHEKWDTLYTTNKFLKQAPNPDSKYNIIGIKTGFTTPAGHNLVTAAVNNEGMELISVVLGVKNERSWENVYLYTQKLLDYGFTNYSIQTLVNSNTLIHNTSVKNAKDNSTLNLIAEESVKCVLPLDRIDLNIQSKIHLKPVVEAPINKGDIIGYIEFFRDELLLGKTNVIAASSIEKSRKAEIISGIQSIWGKLTVSLNNAVNYIRTNALIRTIIKVIYTVLLVLIFFKILRLILRKISRKVQINKINKSP
jgi:D-alanyl-D-alanine carboxypeptidase (penicillin-binding protein 5/6)